MRRRKPRSDPSWIDYSRKSSPASPPSQETSRTQESRYFRRQIKNQTADDAPKTALVTAAFPVEQGRYRRLAFVVGWRFWRRRLAGGGRGPLCLRGGRTGLRVGASPALNPAPACGPQEPAHAIVSGSLDRCAPARPPRHCGPQVLAPDEHPSQGDVHRKQQQGHQQQRSEQLYSSRRPRKVGVVETSRAV